MCIRDSNGAYDLVLLDVMLPIFDGLTVLQQLRRRKDVPVIMLTARVQQHDRILGLDTGADDYLPKPFDPDELLARIRAVLRRTDMADWKGSPVAVSYTHLRNFRRFGSTLRILDDVREVKP